MDQPSVFRLLEVFRAAEAYTDIDSVDFRSSQAFSALETAVSLAKQSPEVQRLADADVMHALGRIAARLTSVRNVDLPSERLALAKRMLRAFGFEVKASEVHYAIQYEIWDKDLCLYHSLDINQFMARVQKTRASLLRGRE